MDVADGVTEAADKTPDAMAMVEQATGEEGELDTVACSSPQEPCVVKLGKEMYAAMGGAGTKRPGSHGKVRVEASALRSVRQDQVTTRWMWRPRGCSSHGDGRPKFVLLAAGHLS